MNGQKEINEENSVVNAEIFQDFFWFLYDRGSLSDEEISLLYPSIRKGNEIAETQLKMEEIMGRRVTDEDRFYSRISKIDTLERKIRELTLEVKRLQKQINS